MNIQDKTKEELIKELEALQQAHNALKASSEATRIAQNQTMEALRESEERFQRLFNKAPLGYQSLDFDGNFIEVNQQWLDTLGYEREEVIGKWFGDFLTPAYQDGFRKRFPIFKEKGKIHSEFEMIHKNGSVLFIAFDGRIGYDDKGDFKQTHCILQDITKRKLAEIALLESEERYALVIEASEQGIWDWNVETNEVFYSEQWKRQIGYEDHELKNDFTTWVEHLHPDEREYCQNAVLSYLNQPIAHFILEFRFHHKDGTYRWIHNKAASLKNSEGKVIRMFGSHTDITERKLAEEKLRENELKHRLLHENAGLGIGYYEPDGTIISYNRLAAKNMNGEPEDFAGKTIFDVFPIPEAEFYLERIKKSCQSDQPIVYEDKLSLPIGNKYFTSTFSKISDPNNQILGIQIISQDITERKQAEESVLQEKKFNQAAIDSLPGLFYLFDEQGRYLRWNKNYEEVSGYSAEEISIMTPLDYFTVPDKSIIKTAIEQVWTTGSVLVEGKFTSKNGSQKPHLFTGHLFWVEGKRCLIGMGIDITELKLAEEKLRESEAIKNTMVSNIGDVVVIIDQNGINQYKSSNITTLFGWQPEELVGKSTWDNVHADDLDAARKFITALATEPNATATTEIRYKRKDGKYVWIEITVANLLSDPYIRGFLGNYHDISDRKKAELELFEVKEKAEESDRLKSAFLANMSHEIRTPMNGILGFAELLKEPDLSGDEQQKYIQIIEKSGARMLSIINDIIDISKIEAGQMKLDLKKTNINEQIEYIYSFFKPEVEAKGIQLTFRNSLPSKQASVETDREKVYAILINLVKNAIKYTNAGSIEIGYDIVETDNNPSLRFYVKDTGIGIPKDRHEAIFERFIQADIADKKANQGAGLGLSITKAYLEMLGGKIWLVSEEGVGSTFYFSLPYNEGPLKELVNQQSAASATTDQVRNLKVLIAEDDDVSELLIEITLTIFSKEIIKARTGIEAVEACKKNPDLDLLLMDIRMPDMGGYEATRQIREFNKEVVIIAQTAYGLSGDRETAIEAGCTDYIAKPINKEELIGLIQKYFQK